MLKRTLIKNLPVGAVFYINGRRYKCYGRVYRDLQVYVGAYEDRKDRIRKLNYLSPDMEVLIEDGKKNYRR